MRKRSIRTAVSAAFAATLISTTAAYAQYSRPDSAAGHAMRVRFAAMVARDFASLDTLFGPELVYTHTSGLTQSKTELLQSMRTGEFTYLAIAPTGVRIELLGNSVVVLSGSSHMTLGGQAGQREFDIRFMDVEVRRATRWVCIRWQSTRIQ